MVGASGAIFGMRRHAQQTTVVRAMALLGAAACALWTVAPRFHAPGFIVMQPNPPRHTSTGYLRQSEESLVGLETESAPSGAAAFGLVGASVAAVSLALGARAAKSARPRSTQAKVVVRAEPDEEESLFGAVEAEAEALAEEAQKAEEAAQEDDEMYAEMQTDQPDGRKRQALQEKIDIYPSKQYVNYIARQNAIRAWQTSPEQQTNMEVKIAIATERIRVLVLECQEQPKNFAARNALVRKVAQRRRMLDSLAWSDFESYINIRETLKIRHNYRIECLIGRASSYKYTVENRKPAPGRKTSMRLKKTRRLLEQRLARSIRQGKSAKILTQTKGKLFGRRWGKSPADEAKDYVSGRDPKLDQLMDPIDVYEQKKWGRS
mmetsp:Transcript_3662/g.8018  ORF Transcript_3662/g.8018 Transcript_3662/m.8018 type:complete len:378 (+) Transcript_3662:76-1209(+)